MNHLLIDILKAPVLHKLKYVSMAVPDLSVDDHFLDSSDSPLAGKSNVH